MSLCERFGWTFDELDSQDEARMLPAVKLANLHAAVRRVQAAVQAKRHPAESDLEAFGYAMGYTDGV